MAVFSSFISSLCTRQTPATTLLKPYFQNKFKIKAIDLYGEWLIQNLKKTECFRLLKILWSDKHSSFREMDAREASSFSTYDSTSCFQLFNLKGINFNLVIFPFVPSTIQFLTKFKTWDTQY